MKSTKTILSLFIFVAVFSSNAFAQNTINANATIVTAISVTGAQDLNFGSIVDGADKQITLADDNSASLGKFDITGVSSGVDIDIELDGPTDLMGSGGATDLLPVTLVAGYADSESATAANGNQISLTDNDGDVTIEAASTTYYVYVGGTADATGGGLSGSYTETITLTVNYN